VRRKGSKSFSSVDPVEYCHGRGWGRGIRSRAVDSPPPPKVPFPSRSQNVDESIATRKMEGKGEADSLVLRLFFLSSSSLFEDWMESVLWVYLWTEMIIINKYVGAFSF
jgi:hypothetical protein